MAVPAQHKDNYEIFHLNIYPYFIYGKMYWLFCNAVDNPGMQSSIYKSYIKL